MLQRWVSITLTALLCVTPVISQNPSSPTPQQAQDDVVRVGTAAVQVDVVVSDATGRRVKGLTAADFQVLDEGAQQRVDYFTAIEGSKATVVDNRKTATPATGAKSGTLVSTPLATPYTGRYVALVFDDLSLSPDNFLRSRSALSDYIKTRLTPNDMAAIVSTGGMLGSLQQFTGDRQRLLSSLNRIAAQNNPAERIRDRRFNITPAEAARIDSGNEAVLNAVVARVSTESLSNQLSTTSTFALNPPPGRGEEPQPRGADKDALVLQVRGAARTIVAQSGLNVRNVLGTLKNLFTGMADLPGRKIVVLMTESLSTLGMTSEDVSNHLVQLAELARRGGISVYALDAAGLRTRSTLASEHVTGVGLQLNATTSELAFSDFESLGAARTLVAATGGQLFANTNDIVAGIERAIEDSSSYYVVGFTPPVLDNKFHRLTISVKSKPEYVVRARRGYLAVNQETVRGTNTELADALLSPVPRLDLPLEVVANVVPKGGAQVVVTGLHVARNFLTLPATTASPSMAEFDVLAWVFAAGRDKPVGVIQTGMTYDLTKPESLNKLKTEGFLLAHTFTELEPGPYQIRAVVREKATGAVGSNYQFFEVPDTTNSKVVNLSSLVLTPAGQTTFSGMNSFKPGKEIDLRFIVYGLPKDTSGIKQQVQLIDAQGRIWLDSSLPLVTAAQSLDPRQVHQGTRLAVPKQRGRYAILVALRDAKGKVDVERRVDFVVD
jgi:VWFA-related protein